LTVIQKVFTGPCRSIGEGFPDLHHGERLALAPVIGLMLLIGILPQLDCGQREPNGSKPAGALEILDVGVDDLSLVCRSAA
jgi:NADH:ubiquinone oxidoreductase subunit 4 (subunit M)